MPLTAAEQTVDIHGYALREIRVREGRKVAELATALGCDRSYIARLELGHARRVSRTFYYKLCDELHVEDKRALLAAAPARDEAVA